MNKKLKKKIVILIIFILTFVNYGLPLKAIATEGTSFFETSIFKKNSVSLKAYYDDNSKSTSKISDVNETVDITVEIKPREEGYLKTGKLSFNLENGDKNNFRIVSVDAESDDTENLQVAPISSDLTSEFTTKSTISGLTADLKSSMEFVKDDESSKNSENLETETNTITADFQTNQTEENNIAKEFEEIVENTNSSENDSELTSNFESTNAVESEDETSNSFENTSDFEDEISNENKDVSEEINQVDFEKVTDKVSEDNLEETEEQEVLIDEEKVIEMATQEAANEKNTLQVNNEVEVTDENEITLQNILGNIVLHVTIEYKNAKEININDLYGKINVDLAGKYINIDLEEIELSESDSLTLGWQYSKEVEIASEYTKIAPFSLGETNGTIVENEISVKREIEETNYLPIKEEKIKIKVPELNGEMPTAVNITANKLMASKGEEFGSVNFDESNWNYDENSNTIEITITNETSGKAVVTSGEDNFIVTYRYEKYTDESTELTKDVEVTVEEYSSNSNNIQTKSIKTEQTKEIDSGELITYSVGTTEDKINKGTINANYYSEEKYETEFTTIVNLNVLTSDMLQEITIKGTKETYEDKRGNTFDALDDVMYKGIAFNYQEIKTMLEKGSSIDLLNEEGEVVYTLTKENVVNSDDCKLTFSENVKGLQVRINNVETDGNIAIEFTKVIGQSKYVASAFSEFSKIRSTVRAYIKYAGMEEEFSLKELETEKSFSDSYTRANLSMNKDSLTTIENNENVELKIELNNNAQTSDLYKNPSFELVFPKYVTNVDIEGMNLVNAEGLRVSDFQTYTKDGIVRVKIELEGTQTGFSTGDLTNGTNIIINTNIEVDEVTPRKEDQIKLYYCNEAVTNYESQTKWTISKSVPNEIIKQTNGFDVAVFEFQAPTGMVAISTIRNYDGNSSEVRSVKQGDIVAKIEREKKAQIASVEITTLNNTGNDCTDLSIIGRIPFEGNKTVTSNEDLGTNVTTPMIDYIKADASNSIDAKIYYSANETANKNLNDESNGWTENVETLSEVRSYLIVVDGTLKAGETLNYTYDVEIPENLPYEVEIYTTFSVYYNNNSDVAVVYESATADKVGLYTEAGPKLEATMSVDIGDGAKVQSARRIKYTVKVENTGSITAENVVVNVTIPDYTNNTTRNENFIHGDWGYCEDSEKELQYSLESIQPGETKEVSYYVTTGIKPRVEEYANGQDENGYYVIINNENGNEEKKYITEIPAIYIKSKAIVTTSILANEIETNETSNELIYSNFKSKLGISDDRTIKKDTQTSFTLNVQNISGKDLKNVVATFNIGEIYRFDSGVIDGDSKNIEYDAENNKIYFKIGDMAKGSSNIIDVNLISNQIEEGSKTVDCYFEFTADGVDAEKSTIIPQTVVKSLLTAEDISLVYPSEIKENSTIVFSTLINNVGGGVCYNGTFEYEITDNFEILEVNCSTGNKLSVDGTKITDSLPLINPNESISIDIKLKAKNLPGTENSVGILNRTVKNEDQDDVILDPASVIIVNNEKTTEEQEEEDFKNEEEKNKQLQEERDKQTSLDAQKENNSANNTNNTEGNTNNSNNVNNTNNTNNTNSSNTNNSDFNSDTLVNNGESSSSDISEYTISGVAWLDENRNGERNEEEELLSGINVYLLDSKNTMIKSTVTSSRGEYIFTDVSVGKYYVAFTYDSEKYAITSYNKTNVSEDRNSDVVASTVENINAISNEVIMANQNIEHLDIGLVENEIFDLQINKYLTHAKVTIKNKTKEYDFDNKEIAKVEIKASELKNATVELEYTIAIENIGNVEGYVEKIVDYLGYDLTFNQEDNSVWYLGDDGKLYTKNLDNASIKPGEKREIKLVLTKKMTTENTGFVSNKVEIVSSYNNSNLIDNTKNNSSTQNTALSVSTGKAGQTTVFIIFELMIIIVLYFRYGTNKFAVKEEKIYKNKFNVKSDLKRKYK